MKKRKIKRNSSRKRSLYFILWQEDVENPQINQQNLINLEEYVGKEKVAYEMISFDGEYSHTEWLVSVNDEKKFIRALNAIITFRGDVLIDQPFKFVVNGKEIYNPTWDDVEQFIEEGKAKRNPKKLSQGKNRYRWYVDCEGSKRIYFDTEQEAHNFAHQKNEEGGRCGYRGEEEDIDTEWLVTWMLGISSAKLNKKIFDNELEGKKFAEEKDKKGYLVSFIAQQKGMGIKSASRNPTGQSGTLFDINSVDEVMDRIKTEVNAPFVSIHKSTLGGKERVAIIFSISLDEKSTWINDIFENSRYGRFDFERDGTLEMFSGWQLKKIKKFRKRKVKSIDDLINTVNSYIMFIEGVEPRHRGVSRNPKQFGNSDIVYLNYVVMEFIEAIEKEDNLHLTSEEKTELYQYAYDDRWADELEAYQFAIIIRLWAEGKWGKDIHPNSLSSFRKSRRNLTQEIETTGLNWIDAGETITSMAEINNFKEAKQCIPAGSYLYREDGELTVVRDSGGRQFWFVWKNGKPKRAKQVEIEKGFMRKNRNRRNPDYKYLTFNSPEEYKKHIQSGGKLEDCVVINGVLFTMDNYDNEGLEVTYGNKTKMLMLGINWDGSRYDDMTAVSDVYVDDMLSYRTGITYYDEAEGRSKSKRNPQGSIGRLKYEIDPSFWNVEELIKDLRKAGVKFKVEYHGKFRTDLLPKTKEDFSLIHHMHYKSGKNYELSSKHRRNPDFIIFFRDLIQDDPDYLMNIDYRERPISEIVREFGYECVENMDYEYSDYKAYLNLKLREIIK